MDRAALVFGFRKDYRDAFQHTKAFIADNETHACKATAFEPGEEVQPAFPVFFHAFWLRLLMVPEETFVPQSVSVISSTRRTDTPTRYISIRASSAEHSRRL